MVKNLLQCGSPRFDPWVWKIPWRRKWLPTPAFLPGEFHGQRRLVGYSSWGHKMLNMTTQQPLFLYTLSRNEPQVGWMASPAFVCWAHDLCSVRSLWADLQSPELLRVWLALLRGCTLPGARLWVAQTACSPRALSRGPLGGACSMACECPRHRAPSHSPSLGQACLLLTHLDFQMGSF